MTTYKFTNSLIYLVHTIIVFLFSILFWSVSSLFFKIALNWWLAPLAAISTAVYLFYLLTPKLTLKGLIRSTLMVMILIGVGLALLITCIGFVYQYYDTSWDGQAYHQDSIISLKNGWNPFYQKLENDSETEYAFLSNAYAKGPWYWSVAIWNTTGNLESGKAVNLLLIIVSFIFSLAVLLRIFYTNPDKLKLIEIVLISVLAAVTPITINQIANFYVDGLLSSVLLLVYCSMWLIYKEPTTRNYILHVLILCIALQIKLTAFVYVVAFQLVFGLILFVNNRGSQLINYVKISVTVLILSFTFFGFSPFVTNAVHYGNPLYLVVGEDNLQLKPTNVPLNYIESDTVVLLALAPFFRADSARVEGGYYVAPAELKNPFTISSSEFSAYHNFPPNIGAMGPLAGLLTILCALALIVTIVKYYFTDRTRYHKDSLLVLNYVLLGIVALLASCLINFAPTSFRYIPQFWFILIAVFIFLLSLKSKLARVYLWLLLVIAIINVGFVGYSYISDANKQKQLITAKLEDLKKANQIGKIIVKPNRMPSILQRLNQSNIEYELVTTDEEFDAKCKLAKYQYFEHNESTICLDYIN